MQDTNVERIKARIRAILAKSGEGAGTTEAEAASALEFARRLMLAHNLTADQVTDKPRSATERAADEEYARAECWTEGATISGWQCALVNAIQILFGTVGVYTEGKRERRTPAGTIEFAPNGKPRTGTRMQWFGPASDARDAAELYGEWCTTIAALARMHYGGALRGPGRSYAEGFAQALKAKAESMEQAERASVAQLAGAPSVSASDLAVIAQSDPGSALVVRASRELMEARRARGAEWLRENGTRLGKASRRSASASTDRDAYASGKAHGSQADFGRTSTRKLR